MSRDPLAEAYDDWCRARTLLTAAQEADLFGEAAAVLEPALENALMRLLLEHQVTSARSLWRAMDTPTLARGFTDVGLDDALAARSARRLLPAVAAARDTAACTPPTTAPRLDDEGLHHGDFTQPRSAPLDRLIRVATARHGEQDGLRHVATAALRYAAVYAKTRHIGPPQRVYDAFYDWGVRNEGFASPFNARVLGKPDAGFFSVFPDTDGPLGSRGSFFHAEHDRFDGAWSVDPPFLPETMARTDRILSTMRARDDAPAILLIVPSTYRPVTPYDEEVRLRRGHHHYEGLDGGLHPLPVDVSIFRFGELPGFDAAVVQEGYRPAA